MITAPFHTIGSAHEARFGEDFDSLLTAAVSSSFEPERVGAELDELTLLSVLSHFAAAGSYDPAQPAVGWGLVQDRDNPRIRAHRYAIHYAADRIDVVTFRGIALAADQSVVFDVAVTPMAQG